MNCPFVLSTFDDNNRNERTNEQQKKNSLKCIHFIHNNVYCIFGHNKQQSQLPANYVTLFELLLQLPYISLIVNFEIVTILFIIKKKKLANTFSLWNGFVYVHEPEMVDMCAHSTFSSFRRTLPRYICSCRINRRGCVVIGAHVCLCLWCLLFVCFISECGACVWWLAPNTRNRKTQRFAAYCLQPNKRVHIGLLCILLLRRSLVPTG